MITVYKFGSYWRLPDIGPFALKLETFLRMAKIPYETAIGEQRKAPKKKLPYIEEDGRLIADSSVIIDHLSEKLGDPLNDKRFSPKDRATARAFKGLLEEELYFHILYNRWYEDSAFDAYKPALFQYCEGIKAPRLLWGPVIAMVRRDLKSQLHQVGISRHDRATIDEKGKDILGAVADHLGDSAYFMGDAPSTIDATAFGMLASLLWAPFDGAVLEYARTRPNLNAYCERMHAAYFGAST